MFARCISPLKAQYENSKLMDAKILTESSLQIFLKATSLHKKSYDKYTLYFRKKINEEDLLV